MNELSKMIGEVEKSLHRLKCKYGMQEDDLGVNTFVPKETMADTGNINKTKYCKESNHDKDDDDDDGDDDDSDSVNYTEESRGDPNFINLSALEEACQIHDLKRVIEENEGLFEVDCQSLEVNVKYTGGCLTSSSTADGYEQQGRLFLSHGGDLSDLYILPYTIEDHRLNTQPDGATTLSMDSLIYQITAAQPQDQDMIVVREEKKCSIIINQSSYDRAQYAVAQSHIWDKERAAFIAPSPYIYGEIIVGTEKQSCGGLYFWDVNSGLDPQIVISSIPLRTAGSGDWWQCYYGNHPREITVADHTGIGIWDIRAHNIPGRSTHRDIFTIPHKSLHSWERVLAIKPHPADHHYYLTATDYSLVLLDDRFPNHTVLHWSHALLSIPQYLDILPQINVSMGYSNDCEDLLLIGSQGVPEIFAQPLQMHNCKPQPPCLSSAPWRVSRMTDFAQLVMRKEPLTCDLTITRRLESPLVGMCGVTHTDGGLSVLQLSSLGDLFCQDYSKMSGLSSGDKTCSTGPGSAEISLCDENFKDALNWLRSAVEYDTVNAAAFEKVDRSDFYQESSRYQITSHILCPLCGSRFSQQRASPTLVENQKDCDPTSTRCYCCSNKTSFTEKLKGVAQKEDCVLSSSDPPVSLPDKLCSQTFDAPEDDLTTRIVLGIWKRDDTSELSRMREDARTKQLKEQFDKWKKKTDEVEEDEEEEQQEEGAVIDLDFASKGSASVDPASPHTTDVANFNNQTLSPAPNLSVESENDPSESEQRPPSRTKHPLTSQHASDISGISNILPSVRRRHYSTSSNSTVMSTASKLSEMGFAATPFKIRESPQRVSKTAAPSSDWFGRSINRLMSPPATQTPPRRKKRKTDTMGF